MIPESRIQASIVAAYKRAGVTVIKQPGPPVGVPDLLILIGDSRHFWIEVKTLSGQLSPQQKSFHRRLQKQGDQVFVCRSRDEAIKILKDITHA